MRPDTGAFYVGRSWSQRGNVVRFNTFDTVRATERLAQQSCSQNAFYLDDQMSGYDFYGNTCAAAALSAVALCDALGLSDQRRCLGAG